MSCELNSVDRDDARHLVRRTVGNPVMKPATVVAFIIGFLTGPIYFNYAYPFLFHIPEWLAGKL